MTTDNSQQQDADGNGGGVFVRVAQEILNTAERMTTTMEEGLQTLFAGSAPSGDKSHEQGFESLANNDDEIVFTEEDYEKIVREQLDGSPLPGIAEQVIGDIMEGQVCGASVQTAANNSMLYRSLTVMITPQIGPKNLSERLNAFRHAINWTEPLLLGIIGFQIFMFLVTLWVSRRGRSMEARLAVMVFIAAIVKCAQRINSYAAQRWEQIATQNYFDQGGIFMSILFCAPLLIDCFIMLVFFLREAASLLVQVKTAELKKKKKQNDRDGKHGSNKKDD